MADWWEAAPKATETGSGNWWDSAPEVSAAAAKAAHQKAVAEQALADQREYNKPETGPAASLERFAAGVGAGMKGLGLGVGQRLGLVDQKSVDQFKDESAPLLGTPAGFIGNLAGQGAALAPVATLAEPVAAGVAGIAAARGAGAITQGIAKAATIGALTGGAAGAATPTSAGESAAVNTAVGAGMGALFGVPAGTLEGLARANNLAVANAKAENSVRDAAAQKASAMGLTLDPAASNPQSSVNSKLQGTLSGKFMTEKTASQRNQPVVNAVAKESLTDAQGTVRFPEDSQLTPDNLNTFRNDVVRAKYEPLKQLGTMPTGGPNGPLMNLVAQAGAKVRALGAKFEIFRSAADDLNANIKNVGGQPTLAADDAITLISEYRSQASHLFQQAGRPGAPRSASQIATAYQEIATALEDFLELRAQMTAGTYQQTGNTAAAQQWAGVMNQFKEGRQLIARSLDVQRTLTPAGNVDARTLALMAQRGRPLGGGLEHLAEVAAQFPKVFQPVDRMGAVPEMSVVDLSIGTGAKLASGKWAAAAMAFSRPGVRRLILSNVYQNVLGMAHPSYATETLAPAAAALGQQGAAALTPQGIGVLNPQFQSQP